MLLKESQDSSRSAKISLCSPPGFDNKKFLSEAGDAEF